MADENPLKRRLSTEDEIKKEDNSDEPEAKAVKTEEDETKRKPDLPKLKMPDKTDEGNSGQKG